MTERPMHSQIANPRSVRFSRLLSWLIENEAKFWIDDGTLRFRVPKGRLTSEHLQELRDFKVELLELFRETPTAEDPIVPRSAACCVPLTTIQTMLWNWIMQTREQRSSRSCRLGVRILGPLNVLVLRECIRALIKRHEPLRTRIVAVDGIPQQQVDASFAYDLETVNLQVIAKQQAEIDVQRRVDEFINEKIDLSESPLFAARLFQLSKSEHVLVLAVDHLVSDGVSMEILDRELWTLYEQATQGSASSLPHMSVQFADYAVWRQRADAEWSERHAPYWQARLRGAPSVKLPRDQGLLRTDSPIGATLNFSLGTALSVGLRDLARNEGTLPALVFLALYLAVMSHWCDEEDLVVCCATTGRDRPELRNMIGFLADPLHLRVAVRAGDRFRDLLRKVVLEFVSASMHPEFFPVANLVPGFTTELHFNWQPFHWIPWIANREGRPVGGLHLKDYPIEVTAAVEFGLGFFDSDQGIRARVLYRPDVFNRSTIENFWQQLRFATERCVECPGTRVSALLHGYKRERVASY